MATEETSNFPFVFETDKYGVARIYDSTPDKRVILRGEYYKTLAVMNSLEKAYRLGMEAAKKNT